MMFGMIVRSGEDLLDQRLRTGWQFVGPRPLPVVVEEKAESVRPRWLWAERSELGPPQGMLGLAQVIARIRRA